MYGNFILTKKKDNPKTNVLVFHEFNINLPYNKEYILLLQYIIKELNIDINDNNIIINKDLNNISFTTTNNLDIINIKKYFTQIPFKGIKGLEYKIWERS